MKKVGVCGHFGGEQVFLDGQTVKTKIITDELKKQLGANEVATVDTYGGIKTILKQLRKLLMLMKECENIIILPAHNSVRVFVPFLAFFKNFWNCRLHYIVIGGWLPEFIKKRRWLGRCLRKFDYIYVETSTMKKALEKQGYCNILTMPNCKNLKILREDELVYPQDEPYRLCTFSRVTEKKGIEDAIKAIQSLNDKYGRTVFSLDIYGQVDEEYKKQFEIIMEKVPEYISYKGMVDFDKSVDVLKQYYALLFPTKFYTEGIPGTIIDAYAAGIPVISSRWESFDDVVDNNLVGKGYKFNCSDELVSVLCYIAEYPEYLVKMKSDCLKKAKKFLASEVVPEIIGGVILRNK